MAHAVAPVPPLGAHQLLVFLVQVGVLLLLALLLGRLAARFGLPAVVGELSAGVLLGPSILDHLAPGLTAWLLPKQVGQFHLLDAVGQFGVLLLVGITGMQMDFGLVRRRGATAARVSVAGLVVPLALGIGVGYLLPGSLLAHADRHVFALFLGVAMCVSAIPVIAKTLLDMRLMHRDVGQLTLAAATVDDAFGWLMLSVVSAMATVGLRAGAVARSLVFLAAVVVFAVLVGRPVVRAVLRATARSTEAQSTEAQSTGDGPTVTAIVVLLVLSAAGTHALGLEAVLGAFGCGILLGSSPELDRSRLAGLRSLTLSVLAPVFFAIAGLRMDLTALGRPAVLLTAVLVLSVAILGKFAGAYLGARLSRLSRWEALALGAGMNARGVIEVIVAMVGLRLGVLDTDMYTVIVLVAVVTSLMAPPMLRVAMRHIEITDDEQAREVRLRGWSTVGAGGGAR